MSPSTISTTPPQVANGHTHSRHGSVSAQGKFFTLREATIPERHYTWKLNCVAWAGPLSEQAYYLREAHLGTQDLTRNGGIQYWVLVHTDVAGDEQPAPEVLDENGQPDFGHVLSACETIRKPAVVLNSEGKMEEVVSYGIGGVFTAPAHRGHGYAKLMLGILAEKLRSITVDGKRCAFSVLYSDIGKKFYAHIGWHPHRSSHISLPPLKDARAASPESTLPYHHLLKADLAGLCDTDCKDLINSMKTSPFPKGIQARLVQLPTIQVIDWQHSREEFVGQYTVQRVPQAKGLWVGLSPNATFEYIEPRGDNAVWAIWTHDFGSSPGKLVILRLHVPALTKENRSSIVESLRLILLAAAKEAADWKFKEVMSWNPEPILEEAAVKAFGPKSSVKEGSWEIVDREEDSIASLMWYGSGDASEKSVHEPANVEWVANEKYAWC